jgi:hypothetical protein
MPKTRLLLIVSLLFVLLSATIVFAAPYFQQPLNPVPVNSTPISRTYAAWQPFQNGVMMWWQDTDQIWVFWNANDGIYNNGGTLLSYQDPWTEGMPNPSMQNCTIPAVRGFGQVWNVTRSFMGCPLAGEIGYDTAARNFSSTQGRIQIQGPGATLYDIDNSSAPVVNWYMVRVF